jgi:hypothetical protein
VVPWRTRFVVVAGLTIGVVLVAFALSRLSSGPEFVDAGSTLSYSVGSYSLQFDSSFVVFLPGVDQDREWAEEFELSESESLYLATLRRNALRAPDSDDPVVVAFRPSSATMSSWQLVAVVPTGSASDWSQFPFEEWRLEQTTRGLERPEGRIVDIEGHSAAGLRVYDPLAGISDPPEGAWVTWLQANIDRLSYTLTITSPAERGFETDLMVLLPIAKTISH